MFCQLFASFCFVWAFFFNPTGLLIFFIFYFYFGFEKECVDVSFCFVFTSCLAGVEAPLLGVWLSFL